LPKAELNGIIKDKVDKLFFKSNKNISDQPQPDIKEYLNKRTKK
jgi:hypothetical protein